MLAAQSQSDPALGWPPLELPLYEVIASEGTLRVSPRSREGHDLVVDLITRLGLNVGPATRQITASGDADLLDQVFKTDVAPRDRAILAAVPDPERGEALASAAPSSETAMPEEQPGQPAASGPVQGGRSPKLLSEMIAQNLKNMGRGQAKASSSVDPRRYILDLLLATLGDMPISNVNVDHANQFADVLGKWPKYAQHHPELKGVSPQRVVARAKKLKLPTICRSTQKKHLQALMAFFNWSREVGEIAENPFSYIENARYKDSGEPKKEPFHALDLEAIFSRKHARKFTEPHKFWGPLIGLYSSMRVNEIAQLYTADVLTNTVLDPQGRRHEVAYFQISDQREGQSVKSEHSRRPIPIHSRLIELGFLEYVEDIRAAGSVHLFPGLPWNQGGPGRAISRWFAKHLRKTCGIEESTKTLHSLRHTVTTTCDRALIPDSIIRTINGHSPGAGVDRKTYIAKGSLWECKSALERLPYPNLDLEPYVSGRFSGYIKHAVAQDQQAGRLRADGKPVVRKKGRPATTKFAPTMKCQATEPSPALEGTG